MKLNQRIFWISVIVSSITLIVSIVLNFFITKTEITEFINGILLNIFAGTIVLVITSLYEYTIQKRDLLENIMLQCLKIRVLFGKIKYFDNREYVTFEQYYNYYKDKLNEKELKQLYDNDKQKYEIEQKKDFEKIIDTYIEIADGDYNEFWKYYDQLKFLFNFKDKEKHKLYYDLFYYIYDEKIIKQALENTLYSLCVYDGDRLIGYGRIIGDKTIFLYIQDIMVIPEYQGKKIGTGIMTELLKQVKEYKKINPNIRTYLGASKGKEDFYKEFGFISRPNEELGAGMILKS